MCLPSSAEDEKEFPMSYEQIRQRYPRLLRAMIWVAVLSEGEAVSAIQGYQATPRREYTSEAVDAFGGASEVIHWASKERSRQVVRYFKAYVREA
jgi:hypothetical protein